MRLPDEGTHLSAGVKPDALDIARDARHERVLLEARRHVRRLGDHIRHIDSWQEDYLTRRSLYRGSRRPS